MISYARPSTSSRPSLYLSFIFQQLPMSQLAPLRLLGRSARAREIADGLQAPITETPFDCSPVFTIKPGQLTPQDISKVEFLAQFGRPMWVSPVFCTDVPHAAGHCRFWTLLAGAEDKDQIISTIVDFARSKLIFQHEISVRHNQVKPAAVSAMLDVLLTLDFEPRCQAVRNREAELVASHMWIAFSVPKDRHYARSGYPSEPLLEAAARQMDEFQMLSSVTYPDTNAMANLLMSEFTSGLLDQGQQGKVVFRLLIWEAYRRAIREDHADSAIDYLVT